MRRIHDFAQKESESQSDFLNEPNPIPNPNTRFLLNRIRILVEFLNESSSKPYSKFLYHFISIKKCDISLIFFR